MPGDTDAADTGCDTGNDAPDCDRETGTGALTMLTPAPLVTGLTGPPDTDNDDAGAADTGV